MLNANIQDDLNNLPNITNVGDVMKGKITREIVEQMKQARLRGATYKEIEQRFNVSRWASIHYLKNVAIDSSYATEQWKKAEKHAVNWLIDNGFDDIVDLNSISPNSYFDIMAKKGKERWVIDVTINEAKDLAAKSLRIIKNYHCAILYFDAELKHGRLVELVEVKS